MSVPGMARASGCAAIVALAVALAPAAAAQSRSRTGSLQTPRGLHSLTLLPGGEGLAAGGSAGPSDATAMVPAYAIRAVQGAELYDPTSGAWRSTGALATGRYAHVAVLLSTGRVLVAGGLGTIERATAPGEQVVPYGPQPATVEDVVALASAELYDPVSGTWRATGTLSRPRSRQQAATLPSGKVVVFAPSSAEPAPEWYDPVTEAWSDAPPITSGPRVGHTVTRVPSGALLVLGGAPGADPATASCPSAAAELRDLDEDRTTPAGALRTARLDHHALPLPSGHVLVYGGRTCAGGEVAATWPHDWELFDPAIGGSIATGPLPTALFEDAAAVVLSSGDVLFCAGPGCWDGSVGGAVAYVFRPGDQTWRTIGVELDPALLDGPAAVLASGAVLVAGGSECATHWYGGTCDFTATTTLFTPPPAGPPLPALELGVTSPQGTAVIVRPPGCAAGGADVATLALPVLWLVLRRRPAPPLA